jgi:peptidoglycan hydrolase FlgJ
VTISSSTDIVLAVALAADPQKYRTAVERLQRMGASGGAAAVAPQADADAARETSQKDVAAVADAAPASRARVASTGTPPSRPSKPDAFAELESFVLQTFIQSMLPKNAAHVFGKGTAGEVWKSMLAEKLGNELARSGQVGLARRLRAGASPNPTGIAAMAPSPALASVLPYMQVSGGGSASSEGAES